MLEGPLETAIALANVAHSTEGCLSKMKRSNVYVCSHRFILNVIVEANLHHSISSAHTITNVCDIVRKKICHTWYVLLQYYDNRNVQDTLISRDTAYTC